MELLAPGLSGEQVGGRSAAGTAREHVALPLEGTPRHGRHPGSKLVSRRAGASGEASQLQPRGGE